MVSVCVGFPIPTAWKLLAREAAPSNFAIAFWDEECDPYEIQCLVLSPRDENVVTCYDQMPNLNAVHVWGVGVDNIPLEYFYQRDIQVLVLEGLSDVPIAEYVMAHVYWWEKRIMALDRYVRAGNWNNAGGRLTFGNALDLAC